MPTFRCVDCDGPVSVSAWDLAIPVLPRAQACPACGARVMPSRRTVVIALVPGIAAGLAAGLANDAWWHVAPPHAVMLVGYWIGVGIGLAIAWRYGGLSAPYGPLR